MLQKSWLPFTIISRELCLWIVLTIPCLVLNGLGEKILAQERKQALLTLDEMKTLAKKMVKVQISCEEMVNLRAFVSRDSLEFSDKNDLLRTYTSIEKDENDIQCARIDTSLQWKNFEVFICWRKYVSHLSYYVIALGYDGSSYFLHGFDKSDFQALLKHKIRSISTKDEAALIAKLYLDTVMPVSAKRLIIDWANVPMHKTKGIAPTRVNQKGKTFEVSFYTVTKYSEYSAGEDEIVFHKFSITQDCEIHYERELMKGEGGKF